MKPNITHITKLEVKGLWERYDIDWRLNPDVNILIGINGSGKTTLLKLIDSVILQNNYFVKFKVASISIFYNRKYRTKIFKDSNYKAKKYDYEIMDDKSLEVLKKATSLNRNFLHASNSNFFTKDEKRKNRNTPYINFINYALIDTFEFNIKSVDKTKITEIKGIETHLDWELWLLEKEYISYQLTIGKRVEKLIFEATTNNLGEIREEIYGKKNLFISTINRLFSKTDKKISSDEKDNSIVFLQGNLKLTSYQLSSGEKQILIILLKVLLQDNQPSILLMDEPEISLHLEWQQQLIDCIRTLNENCQIIIATHSPSIFAKGWFDKITRMEDIVHPTKVAINTDDH